MRTKRPLTPFLLVPLLVFPVLAGGGSEECPATASSIVINEIMYDPPGNPDVEYIELYNNGVATVDLTDWYLLDDVDTHADSP